MINFKIKLKKVIEVYLIKISLFTVKKFINENKR